MRRIASFTIGTDNAESGFGAWDTLLFSSSTARRASGLRSFWSGSGNSRTSTLTSLGALDAAPGESLVVMAYWDLENNFDYSFAEASEDGGSTWIRLPGNVTTVSNPNSKPARLAVTMTRRFIDPPVVCRI